MVVIVFSVTKIETKFIKELDLVALFDSEKLNFFNIFVNLLFVEIVPNKIYNRIQENRKHKCGDF